jgi:ubiquinone/menaquinone biosynthesis C-methylase UbiE
MKHRRYILESLLGTKYNELFWRFRHIYKPDWTDGYINSFSHPHRQLLIKKISANAPFMDVLEIGCATGPNLYLLVKRFPNVNFAGIDINPKAIRDGKTFFKRQGIHNVVLFVEKADKLWRFSDKSFDVVFTDAVLMCIGSDQIQKVAYEMQRISKKTIIMVEHHSDQETALGSHNERWWLRNYKELFQSSSVKTTKIPSEVWGGDWGKFGYIIEVQTR